MVKMTQPSPTQSVLRIVPDNVLTFDKLTDVFNL
jgi:hypothetical protein